MNRKLIIKIALFLTLSVALLVINNNFLKRVDVVIKADGAGYYDYLPSIFIHHDFNRKNEKKLDSLPFKRVLNSDFNVDFLHHKVNKYPIGTALLQSPFFFISYSIISFQQDYFTGFELIFQKGILYSALFYTFLGLFFLFKTLQLYQINKIVSSFIIVFTALATNIIHYASFDASYSHVFSFFLIATFLYFVKLYTIKRDNNSIIWTFIFLGLIILTRQINLLIILFIPFLFTSFKDFTSSIIALTKSHKKVLLIGMICLLLILCIQCLAWYFQTGHYILYSYQNEHFNFLKPELFKLFFSYRKGLFIYTPLLLIAIISFLVYYLQQKKFFHLFAWLLPFLFISYIFSSWWSWFYGSSLGMRVFVDYYAVFMIPFAIALNALKIYLSASIICISLLFVPYSFILNFQYKNFIIHWIDMNKNMYWFTFLKTKNTYKGLIWLDKTTHHLPKIKTILAPTIVIAPNQKKTLVIDTISNPSKLKYIKIKLHNYQVFNEKNNSVFDATISKPNEKECYFFHQFYLFHFIDYVNPKKQTGVYVFKVENDLDPSNTIFKLEFASYKYFNKFSNISIEYY